MDLMGIRVVKMNEFQMSEFYTNLEENVYECKINEYLVPQSESGEVYSPYYWNGAKFVEVQKIVFNSSHFGKVTSKENDPYQMAFMDSISRNQLTFATGPAGSGKTMLGLTYALQELERGKIDKIVVFTNPYIARSAVKLGFLPGDKIEKLLETNIGGILASKLGARHIVEQFMAQEKLELMPIGDCRGYEVPPNSLVYFTEAQNTNIYLMQLFLQRLTDECKVIVEGDVKSQVDSDEFSCNKNGLARAIQVFANEPYVGRVQLKNIYRGRIALKAEEM